MVEPRDNTNVEVLPLQVQEFGFVESSAGEDARRRSSTLLTPAKKSGDLHSVGKTRASISLPIRAKTTGSSLTASGTSWLATYCANIK